VTSGGQLGELADQNGDPLIVIPGGQPPRTALGYMFVPVVVACERLGLLMEQHHEQTFALLDSCISEWGIEQPFDSNPAKRLAQTLHGKLSVLYGLGSWQGLVANRWKGQINENSKNMTFANSFPELNHNEILGWVKSDGQGVAAWETVILESGDESEKMKTRAGVTGELIASKSGVHRVRAKGETLYERILSLTFMGDFVSLYLAALNGVDPENIDAINHLKSALASVV
jgi:glucose/mannose-6-phosphate isomerase